MTRSFCVFEAFPHNGSKVQRFALRAKPLFSVAKVRKRAAPALARLPGKALNATAA